MAQNGPTSGPTSGPYLALGDSLPFGYNPLIQPPDLADYLGYPTLISAITKNSLTNASCPFETTGTFLSGGTTPDGAFGCQVWRTTSGLKKPLFVSYMGPQMDYAASFLQSHPNTQMVTLQLGGNDLADVQLLCNGDSVCELLNLPAALVQIGANLSTTIANIRGAGYSGLIVLVNYYAFNYTSLSQTTAFSALAQTMDVVALSPNVKVADVFKAFALASAPFHGDTCAAGLRIMLNHFNPLTGDNCDVHPSFAGHALIAGADFTAQVH